jgi:hypothetical protein
VVFIFLAPDEHALTMIHSATCYRIGKKRAEAQRGSGTEKRAEVMQQGAAKRDEACGRSSVPQTS